MTSSNGTAWDWARVQPVLYIYFVQGVVAVVCNALVRKRKELLVVAALAFADFVVGWGFFYAAVHRAPLQATGRSKE